ncbi:hypothetical protein, partial [Acinetobacter baumannii]|uniref:hypothetical protein n=1 Tax=Acinetobacter baumannii TaxID=470 RepID=UPI001C066027
FPHCIVSLLGQRCFFFILDKIFIAASRKNFLIFFENGKFPGGGSEIQVIRKKGFTSINYTLMCN